MANISRIEYYIQRIICLPCDSVIRGSYYQLERILNDLFSLALLSFFFV